MTPLPARIDLFKLLPPGSVMAEVGVWRGYLSIEILNKCPNVAKLFLIDAWRRQVWSAYEQQSDQQHEADLAECRRHIGGHLPSGRVRVIRGTSAEVALHDRTIPPLDFVYIDAAHEYRFVMEDLTNWSKRLKPTGAIGGHDYTHNPDSKKWGFGVIEAVNDFCRDNGWTITHLTTEDFASYRLERNAP